MTIFFFHIYSEQFNQNDFSALWWINDKNQRHEAKKYLKLYDKMLGKVTIDIVKLDDTKILIKTDNRLPEYITLKHVVVLITCHVKDDDKFYPEVILEEALYNE